jgi:hypothetical protein
VFGPKTKRRSLEEIAAEASGGTAGAIDAHPVAASK